MAISKFLRNKKANRIEKWEYILLKSIAEALPAKFSDLAKQINKGFVLGVVAEVSVEGWKRTILNLSLLSQYRNASLTCHLKGIKVFETRSNGFKEIEMDLYQGILFGYKVTKGVYDTGRVDVSRLIESPLDIPEIWRRDFE